MRDGSSRCGERRRAPGRNRGRAADAFVRRHAGAARPNGRL